MIVLIVAIGALSKTFRHRAQSSTHEADDTLDYLKRHIQRLESRMTNVETIVIDDEKEKRFTEL